MEFLNNYIVLVVVGICLCAGYVMKHLIPAQWVNRYIPLAMAVLGVLVNIWANGWTATPEILLGGLTSGLASTGLYEAFRNFINNQETDGQQ